MKKDAALTRILQLARQIAWSPYMEVSSLKKQQLREALQIYKDEVNKPTAYTLLLEDGDLFEGPEAGTRCLWCKLPFHLRKQGQKYCSTTCRKRAWTARPKAV